MAISNRSDEAIFLYKKAAEIKPDDPESYNNLGEILFKTGRIEDAKANLQRALDINPKYPEAHNNLGTLLEKAVSSTRQLTIIGRLWNSIPTFRMLIKTSVHF